MVSVEDRGETTTVYNLEVRRSHTYYAGALRAWVHNPCNGKYPQRGVRQEQMEEWVCDTVVSMFKNNNSIQKIRNSVGTTIRGAGLTEESFLELMKYMEKLFDIFPNRTT